MKGELKMDVNDYLPLRDVVFNTLRQAILRGEMEPGERLMEIQLAQKLGVSRTPIREAIRKLELEGLVIMIPRKGAEVAHITEKDMRDVLEVRCTLEGGGSRTGSCFGCCCHHLCFREYHSCRRSYCSSQNDLWRKL